MRSILAFVASLWLAAAAAQGLPADNAKAPAKPRPAGTSAQEAKPAPGAKGVKPARDAKGVKAAGPRLQMADPDRKNPHGDRDVRYCLDLPTEKEVIRCTERK